MRFRDGERGGRRGRALRAARERRAVIREFSAGGVVIRQMQGPPVRGGGARARPDPRAAEGPPRRRASPPQEAARARCARRPGSRPSLVEKLGDIRYWYARDGERVLKIVSLLPVPLPLGAASRTTTTRSRRRSGSRSRRRPSGSPTRASATWRRPRFRASAQGRRLPRRVRPQLLLARSSSTSSSAAARPPRSGSATRARSTARARSC